MKNVIKYSIENRFKYIPYIKLCFNNILIMLYTNLVQLFSSFDFLELENV